jgi:hypothetical protein
MLIFKEFVCTSINMHWTHICFCSTTLRDVILVEPYFIGVMSTTCVLQHAVVCWDTAT